MAFFMSQDINMLSTRKINTGIFLYVVALWAFALYSQHYMGMHPCSLCITQRVFFFLVGLLALLAAVHDPKSWARRIYPLLGLLFAIIGGGFAARQLWLQSLPEDQVPACGPGLTYIMDNFPLIDALKLLLKGDGNCAKVDTILGLSYALWSLMAFVLLSLVNLFQLFRKTR
jgi:disulfide bond formation protein DsbB